MRAWFSSGQAWTNPCQSSECRCSDFGAGEEVWEMRWELCQTTTSANSVVLISSSFESQVQRVYNRSTVTLVTLVDTIDSFFHSFILFFRQLQEFVKAPSAELREAALLSHFESSQKKHTTWKQPLVGRRATCFLVFSSFSWKSCSWYAKRKLLTPCQLVFHHCKTYLSIHTNWFCWGLASRNYNSRVIIFCSTKEVHAAVSRVFRSTNRQLWQFEASPGSESLCQVTHRLAIIFGLCGLKFAEIHGNLSQAKMMLPCQCWSSLQTTVSSNSFLVHDLQSSWCESWGWCLHLRRVSFNLMFIASLLSLLLKSALAPGLQVPRW